MQVVTGNIIEENHYYAYGLKIAAISSKKLPDTYEGVIKNNYLYNDKELFEDGDLNWYDYGFRNYDPKIGRFVQIDPLTSRYPFFSPYLYAGNEPIGNIDFMGMGPETGLTAGTAKVMGEVIVKSVSRAVATTARAVTNLGLSITTISVQFFITGCNAINTSITTQQAGTGAVNNESDSPSPWQPLYKSDLIDIYKEKFHKDPTENELGTYFEDQLEKVVTKRNVGNLGMNMKRNSEKYTDADDRNTVPDFVGDAVTGYKNSSKRIPGGSIIEVKQKKGGLYLSSNDYQIKGHIDNLRKRMSRAINNNRGFSPKMALVTTADVSASPKMYKYALSENIEFVHIHAEFYREVTNDGKIVFHFRFVKHVTKYYGN